MLYEHVKSVVFCGPMEFEPHQSADITRETVLFSGAAHYKLCNSSRIFAPNP